MVKHDERFLSDFTRDDPPLRVSLPGQNADGGDLNRGHGAYPRCNLTMSFQ